MAKTSSTVASKVKTECEKKVGPEIDLIFPRFGMNSSARDLPRDDVCSETVIAPTKRSEWRRRVLTERDHLSKLEFPKVVHADTVRGGLQSDPSLVTRFQTYRRETDSKS